MAKLTFRGGIHPYDGKEMSKNIPIKAVDPKSDLVFPLSQHIGAPAKPIVSKGDYVLVGQKIAEADGFVSSPVYSSVSGTVKEIEERLTVSGDKKLSVVIENDGNYSEAQGFYVKPLDEMEDAEIIDRVKEAGIVGLGGAGFPTHVKLSVKEPQKIDYVIVNGAECEPYLTSDYRKMIEEPEKIIEGLKVYLKLFPYSLGIIAIEDNKEDCIKIFKALTKEEPRIIVKALKTKYPQGSERHLIYAVTGREINSKMLPADVGCVVNNVDTILAVREAIYEGRPLLYRIVTLSGNAVKNPRNYRVRIGTSFRDIVDENGGVKKDPVKVIAGGPMMGQSLYSLDVPVTKTSSALLLFADDDIVEEASSCINCGRCVSVCPERLIPGNLCEYGEHFDSEKFLDYNGLECIECGSCSYVCPAKRPLAQVIKTMRKTELEKKKKTGGK